MFRSHYDSALVMCEVRFHSVFLAELAEAVKAQHLEIVDLLSAAKCDVNSAEMDHEHAPIHVAVREGKRTSPRNSRSTWLRTLHLCVVLCS